MAGRGKIARKVQVVWSGLCLGTKGKTYSKLRDLTLSTPIQWSTWSQEFSHWILMRCVVSQVDWHHTGSDRVLHCTACPYWQVMHAAPPGGTGSRGGQLLWGNRPAAPSARKYGYPWEGVKKVAESQGLTLCSCNGAWSRIGLTHQPEPVGSHWR